MMPIGFSHSHALCYSLCCEGTKDSNSYRSNQNSSGGCSFAFSAAAGSVELAEKVAAAFKDASVKAVLLREHGVVVVGRNIKEAFNTTALVKDIAEVAFLSSHYYETE